MPKEEKREKRANNKILKNAAKILLRV